MPTTDLTEAKVRILTCTACGLSQRCRSPIPIRTRQTNPTFMVLGEAPGQIEDRKGEPFVGPAGMFLKRELRRVGLFNSDGAWFNTVSCFPVAHKTPTAEEVSACRGNLYNQWHSLDTRYVLVCGTMALSALMPHAQMMYAQGRPIPIHKKVIFPVYHPAYILRSRQILEGWQRQLAIFAQMVLADEVPTWQSLQHKHCLYCNVGVEGLTNPRVEVIYQMTCSTHRKTLLRDGLWKPPKSIPLRLF